MSLLLFVATLATGLALGGMALARYRHSESVIVSLIRADDIDREAAREEWACDCWELQR